jgi:hypothetical protein
MKASLRTRPPRADLRPVALRSCIHGNVAGEVGEIGAAAAAGRGAAAIAAAAGGGTCTAGAGASFLGDCATSARRWSSSLLCPPPAPPPRPSRSLLSGVGPPTGAAFAVSDFVSVAAWEEREREREKKRGRAGRQVAVVVARSRTGLLISESEQREVYFPRALVSATARGISPRGSRDLRPRGKTRRTREDAPSSVYASSWRPSRAARRASLRRAGEATTGGRMDWNNTSQRGFRAGKRQGSCVFYARNSRARARARRARARAATSKSMRRRRESVLERLERDVISRGARDETDGATRRESNARRDARGRTGRLSARLGLRARMETRGRRRLRERERRRRDGGQRRRSRKTREKTSSAAEKSARRRAARAHRRRRDRLAVALYPHSSSLEKTARVPRARALAGRVARSSASTRARTRAMPMVEEAFADASGYRRGASCARASRVASARDGVRSARR